MQRLIKRTALSAPSTTKTRIHTIAHLFHRGTILVHYSCRRYVVVLQGWAGILNVIFMATSNIIRSEQ